MLVTAKGPVRITAAPVTQKLCSQRSVLDEPLKALLATAAQPKQTRKKRAPRKPKSASRTADAAGAAPGTT